MFLGLASLGILVPETAAQAPERVILFHIDALHPDAPRRLGLRNILQLAQQGTSVAEAITILPWHPTTGPYGATHTTSLPNPVALAGTLFLRPGQKMLQHCFYPGQLTAHMANSTAYESLNPGFHYVALDRTNADADVVRLALDLLERKDVRFMRILLQELNSRASYLVATTTEPVPWRRNIWAEGSPYIERAREADWLLGEFLAGLERMGKREGTLLVLLSDGQADVGWHPVLSEESWRIPLIIRWARNRVRTRNPLRREHRCRSHDLRAGRRAGRLTRGRARGACSGRFSKTSPYPRRRPPSASSNSTH